MPVPGQEGIEGNFSKCNNNSFRGGGHHLPTNQIEQITLRVTTCEEDEEQSKTVEEDELKQEDNAKEPVEGSH